MANLKVDLIVDDKGTAVFKKFGKHTDTSMKKAAISVKNAGAKMKKGLLAVGIAAAGLTAAFYGVTRVAMKFVDAANLQEEAEANLKAVLEATGHAAGYNFEQMTKMARGFQEVTRYGDETVIAGQAILATFKNIRGEAFEATTRAVLDMATVMKKADLKDTFLQIGKALNDPIANMGALGRAGVQFTKEQKALIKTLWESGQRMEAQNVLLGELQSQFGGAASAARDTFGFAIDQAKNATGDLYEEIGFLITKNKELVNTIHGVTDQIVEWSKYIAANREEVNKWINETIVESLDKLEAMAKAVLKVASALITFHGWTVEARLGWYKFIGLADDGVTSLEEVGKALESPAWAQGVDYIKITSNSLGKLAEAAGKVAPKIKEIPLALEDVRDLAAQYADFGDTFEQLSAYVVQAEIDWQKWMETYQATTQDATKEIKTFFDGLKDGWNESLEAQERWYNEGRYLVDAWIQSLEYAVGDTLYDIFTGNFDDISDVWQSMLKSMLAAFTDFLGMLVVEWAKLKFAKMVLPFSLPALSLPGGGAAAAATGTGAASVAAAAAKALPVVAIAAIAVKVFSELFKNKPFSEGPSAMEKLRDYESGKLALTPEEYELLKGAHIEHMGRQMADSMGMAIDRFDSGMDIVLQNLSKYFETLPKDTADTLAERFGDLQVSDAYKDMIETYTKAAKEGFDSLYAFDLGVDEKYLNEIASSIHSTMGDKLAALGLVATESGWESTVVLDFVTRMAENESMRIEDKLDALGFVATSTGWESPATIKMLAELSDEGLAWTSVKEMLALFGVDEEMILRIRAEYLEGKIGLDLEAFTKLLSGAGIDAESIVRIKTQFENREGEMTWEDLMKMLEKMGIGDELINKLFGEINPSDELQELADEGVRPSDDLWEIYKNGIPVNIPKFPGRQHGGDVAAHQAVIVGESRAELFIPKVPGKILPDLSGLTGARSPQAGRSDELDDFWKKYYKALSDQLGLMTDLDSTIYDLNKKWDDFIKKAKELGATEEKLKELEEDRLKAIAKAIEDFIISAQAPLQAVMDSWRDFMAEITGTSAADKALEDIKRWRKEQGLGKGIGLLDFKGMDKDQIKEYGKLIAGYYAAQLQALEEQYNAWLEAKGQAETLIVDMKKAVADVGPVLKSIPKLAGKSIEDVSEYLNAMGEWLGRATALMGQYDSFRDSIREQTQSIRREAATYGMEDAELLSWYSTEFWKGLSDIASMSAEDALEKAKDLQTLIMDRYALEKTELEAIIGLVADIDGKIQDLRYSSFNLALPGVRAAAAGGDYAQLLAGARGGSADDISKYLGFIDTYLGESQAAFKSSEAYLDIWTQVQNDLEELGLQTEKAMSQEGRLLTSIEQIQTDALNQLALIDQAVVAQAETLKDAIREQTEILGGMIGKDGVIENALKDIAKQMLKMHKEMMFALDAIRLAIDQQGPKIPNPAQAAEYQRPLNIITEIDGKQVIYANIGIVKAAADEVRVSANERPGNELRTLYHYY